MLRQLLTVAVVSFASAASAAEVYKWTDSAGVVHYTDAEPAADTKAERIHVAGMGKPPAAADADAAAGDGDTNARAEPAPAGTVVTSDQAAQTRCEVARKSLEVLQTKGAVGLDTGAAGAPQPLDDAARQAQIARAQSMIATYCK
jgi:hypothetical protein